MLCECVQGVFACGFPFLCLCLFVVFPCVSVSVFARCMRKGNDGNGRQSTDRSNLVQLSDREARRRESRKNGGNSRLSRRGKKWQTGR